jgi:NadR type nicotinamide-nucleotide adenylyltransferase
MEKIDRPTRVVLIGPQSTGKSELARALAVHFAVPWTEEYAREYALANPRELTVDDVEPIARGQMANEDAAEVGGATLILDTDLISTVVYARHYYGRCPDWIERAARARAADLYLLMHIDTPFVDDPARDSADRREELFAKFHGGLQEFGVRFHIIRGDWNERQRKAKEAIEALLRAKS